MNQYCHLYLSCADDSEAARIADELIKQKLIACAKTVKLDAVAYWWKGEIAHSKESLLIMQSRVDLFDAVESVIESLHSYDTFVLEMTTIEKINQKAAEWLNSNLAK